jgi:hypothetical protein
VTFMRLTTVGGDACVVRLDLVEAVQDGWTEMRRDASGQRYRSEPCTRVILKDGASVDIRESAVEFMELIKTAIQK